MYLIGDFNLDYLKRIIENNTEFCNLERTVDLAPYGQSVSELFEIANENRNCNSVFIWCVAEKISSVFNALLEGKSVDVKAAEAEIEVFCQLLVRVASQVGTLIVADLTTLHNTRGSGAIENRPPNGTSYLLAKFNLILRERVSICENIHVLNSQNWLMSSGENARDPRSWFMAKVPFSQQVFKEALRDILALLNLKNGFVRKLLIVDLDNTLWGGVIGDDGIDAIKLGGHDPLGEAYADFQRCLKTLHRKGILLAISSKNDESIALHTIQSHEAMQLGIDDFIAWRIDWNDKAANIVDICKQLNLGLDAVVFLDDNPAERGRVREALPEVLVPELPQNPMLYAEHLNSLTCFDKLEFTAEDSRRTATYKEEQVRSRNLQMCTSHEQWLESLELTVDIKIVDTSNIQRVVQLLNKTNQMNFLTRRLSRQEVLTWVDNADRSLFAFYVSDRYGDSGLSGIVSIDCVENNFQTVDFVLSCRVFNRSIENVMLAKAKNHAIRHGAKYLRVSFEKTSKNTPSIDFLLNSQYVESHSDSLFVYSLEDEHHYPARITVHDHST